MLQKISVSDKCCYFEFSIKSKNHEKTLIMVSKALTVFNTGDNKKCFLRSKLAYFWRIMWHQTLE